MTTNCDYTNNVMKNATLEKASFTHHTHNILHCNCYEHGIVVPHWGDGIPNNWDSGGVLTQDGEQVIDSVFIPGEFRVRAPGTNGIAEDSSDVIYIGSFHPMYGHVITDGLKLLWFLYTEEGKILIEKGAKLVYTTIFHAPLPKWTFEILSLAGVDITRTEQVLTTTRYGRIYVPQPSITLSAEDRFYNDEYLQVINTIKSSIKPKYHFERLYFTRTKFAQKNKDGDGEKEIEKLFAQKGYTIIAPEEYSITEQVAMLMSCKEFVATEGSISHNAIFCNPGTKHVILRKANFVNSYQIMINEAAKLDAIYIDAHNSIMVSKVTPWFGPFYLSATKEVFRYLNLREPHNTLWLRISLWKYILTYCKLTQDTIEQLRKVKLRLRRLLH